MSFRQRDEDGFVLMTAVWLLMLCAAVVAVMMIKTRALGKETNQQGVRYQADLDARSAIETVAADLLIRGGSSRWALLPASGGVDLDGRQVQVTITSEAGRLDLNKADPNQIDAALMGLGFAAARRGTFISALQAARAQGRISSASTMDRLLTEIEDKAPSAPCARDIFTVAGGASLDPNRSSSKLLKALGIPSTGDRASVRIGEALRWNMSGPGSLRTYVARVGMQGSDPVSILQSVNSAQLGCN